uniref:Calcineurin-like phosphoesterase domain-containing protein n=1 Tax=Populus trichocarpa TaxID=3694 RepID=A0A2K2C521_POPTR
MVPVYSAVMSLPALIQLGDILDRGEEEIAILSSLLSLGIQAKAQGGAVFQNHWGPWNLVKKVSLYSLYLSACGTFTDDIVLNYEDRDKRRSIMLRPGGPLPCQLAQHAVVLEINDWIFCHGGLLPRHVAYGIERMNKEVSQWTRGLSEDDDIHNFPSMPVPRK